eukprot:TRINITY_DN1101_c0_g1_i1.p1 TRINITY_DN1101_c0_g1~~TRINITY_DN1101_c0_g1_i1.p1  ORF type:complete len:155 (+),score=4.19 TRINITY_DN1101_c0_g1_i1:185-649(+)
MSATILSDSVAASESQSTATKTANQIEVEFAKCDCCGLTEECTLPYIARVRERYQGKWICGLCSEAGEDEIYRSDRLIGTEEALNRHLNFCKKFTSSSPPNPSDLITAMRQILRRSFDSPRVLRSTPSSPSRKEDDVPRHSLARSGSCFSTLAR